MIELLELETIRRIGEMIKGIGSQMIDYTVKKKEQLAEQEQLDANNMAGPKGEQVVIKHIRTAQLHRKL